MTLESSLRSPVGYSGTYQVHNQNIVNKIFFLKKYNSLRNKNQIKKLLVFLFFYKRYLHYR